MTSRCGSLRPSIYANVRCIDDVIAIEGQVQHPRCTVRLAVGIRNDSAVELPGDVGLDSRIPKLESGHKSGNGGNQHACFDFARDEYRV